MDRWQYDSLMYESESFQNKPLDHPALCEGNALRMHAMSEQEDQFTAAYSDSDFWDKIKNYAKTAGESVLEPALKMYYAALDADTPAWAKATIIGALGYFISPVDAIPDLIPVVGYTDDLSILAAALAATAANIKDVHVAKTKETLAQWFH